MESAETQKERVRKYVADLIELHDPMLKKEYFRSYHFRPEEEKLFEFWKKSINGLYKRGACTHVLTKHKIKSNFMIDRVIPYGLDNILVEMVKRAQLIPLELLRSREYYREQNAKTGWIKWFFSKLYNGTLGWLFSKPMVIPDSTTLVSVSYLNSIYKKIAAKQFHKNQSLLSEPCLKKELELLQINDSGKELFLIHFEEQHKLFKFTIEINNEKLNCYKLIGPYADSQAVSPKEKATLMLNMNIENLSKKLDVLEGKIQSCLNEAKEMKAKKRREVALFLLKQRKMFQGYWEKFAILKYQLENQLLKIDTLEANDNLVKAFKIAEAAHKSIKTDLQDVETVLEKMEIQKEEQEKIHAAILKHAPLVEEDDDILKELEMLGETESIPSMKMAPEAPKTAISKAATKPKEDQKKMILSQFIFGYCC